MIDYELIVDKLINRIQSNGDLTKEIIHDFRELYLYKTAEEIDMLIQEHISDVLGTIKENYESKRTFLLKDNESGEVFTWSMVEILAEINRDHSDEYIPYNHTDVLEGWKFNDGEFYTLIGEVTPIAEK